MKYNPIINTENEREEKKYFCKFCDKEFTHYQNRWRHQKKCENNEIDKLKKENQELKEMFEKEIASLKEQLLDTMNKNCKKHPKTLQKINRQLNSQYNNTQNNTNCM